MERATRKAYHQRNGQLEKWKTGKVENRSSSNSRNNNQQQHFVLLTLWIREFMQLKSGQVTNLCMPCIPQQQKEMAIGGVEREG